MSNLIDLTGSKVGRLTVLRRAEDAPSRARRWVCLCECGQETISDGQRLRKGTIKSCGCYARELQSRRAQTHGMSKSREWATWKSMRDRCENPNLTGYANYGGRGIRVCERWSKFENFYADMGPKPSPAHSIERRDVNGNYEPDNCHWTPLSDQANNRRNTRRVVYRGREMPLTTAVREAGGVIHHEAAWIRMTRCGWTVEDALETPRTMESPAAGYWRGLRK